MVRLKVGSDGLFGKLLRLVGWFCFGWFWFDYVGVLFLVVCLMWVCWSCWGVELIVFD